MSAADTIAAGRLRAFIERIERIEAEIKDLNADKSEIYKELRGVGFDVKAVRQCVSARKLDSAERQERDAIFDLYWEALNGASRVHVHEEHKSDGPKSRPGDAAASLTQQSNSPRQERPSAQERSSDRSGGQFGDAPKPAPIPEQFEPPAFLQKDRAPLRPHCLHPDNLELCAGSGSKHCYSCLKARDELLVPA